MVLCAQLDVAFGLPSRSVENVSLLADRVTAICDGVVCIFICTGDELMAFKQLGQMVYLSEGRPAPIYVLPRTKLRIGIEDLSTYLGKT